MKIVVIGGGPGGYVAALKAAMLGADVTVVEKGKVGGTCLNVGCIPTKALLACSDVLNTVKEAKKFGINFEADVKADFAAIMERKEKVVTNLVKGIEYLFESKGVKLVRGAGRLVSNKEVEVTKEDGTKESIPADKIILATGSIPVVPRFLPYDGKNVMTSDEVLNLKEQPKSMIVVGGGVIGCEIGQFLSRLGTEVKIVEMLPQLLPLEDEDTAKILQRSFKQGKIKFFVGDGISTVEVGEGNVVATLQSGKKVEAEKMLVAIGRRPYTDGLGLEELGIQADRGKVIVNEYLETNIEGIYAIGDLTISPDLAHVASRQGIVAVENAILDKKKKMSYKAVPGCVFTEPEVASVGMKEKQAKDAGINYKVGKFDFRGLGKAQAMGKLQGFVKVITDEKDVIIGAAIIGERAADMLGELTVACEFGLTAEQVGEVIHPHPTLCEGIMEALHDVHKQCVHSVE
ncbi:pyridine nucleotide-disulfide oxidoreductase [Clostridium carboxidivorans P7]|uniref:Dihydrolipoyl dehydrogenase n=1 Tax=Clostridium carboxidivorans P7 TaxID=536227 RepID=C6PVX2_9CLOT|nr:dihydrolipoyl dehydrogenase [Clostridium carboxidivorans]ADO12096.1 dihydrolipoamide dehydrogenase [Clostridium carboxidivorans P7]AKN32781.1 pyridine nucleotide-disulfide oxidoreductase [Clostridium carboxidivorans P7]EET86603.1 dihydrolipoamide dehydrogenase [Clostridium carboxidivorans P7]EFG89980.1 dihydrolipoyl dehydrogenase [Clostridium carboxidivorans P7]